MSCHLLCSMHTVYTFKSPVLCILRPGRSIKFSIDRTDLGNKANREASCAFGEVCLLTGRDSEHTLRHRDRDHYWAVCHQGNCSYPYTVKNVHLNKWFIYFIQTQNHCSTSVTTWREGRLLIHLLISYLTHLSIIHNSSGAADPIWTRFEGNDSLQPRFFIYVLLCDTQNY